MGMAAESMRNSGQGTSKAEGDWPDQKWVVEWLVKREGQRKTASLLGVNRKTVALALRRKRLTRGMALAVERFMVSLDDPGWERTTPLDRLESRIRLAIDGVDDLVRLVEDLTRRVDALEASREENNDSGGKPVDASEDGRRGLRLFNWRRRQPLSEEENDG